MVEVFGIIATILAVGGVVFNNRLRRACFIFWMISNLITAGLHCHAGIWSLLARDLIFFGLAIEGYIRWGRAKRRTVTARDISKYGGLTNAERAKGIR